MAGLFILDSSARHDMKEKCQSRCKRLKKTSLRPPDEGRRRQFFDTRTLNLPDGRDTPVKCIPEAELIKFTHPISSTPPLNFTWGQKVRNFPLEFPNEATYHVIWNKLGERRWRFYVLPKFSAVRSPRLRETRRLCPPVNSGPRKCVESPSSVSYTHLTLPTIYSV